jgi:hypothetical protein
MTIFKHVNGTWVGAGQPLWNLSSAYHYLARQMSAEDPGTLYCVTITDDRHAQPDPNRDSYYRDGEQLPEGVAV